jgi:predicted amidohydrolase
MRISCLQYTAEADFEVSWSRLEPLLLEAMAAAPDCIVLPECALYLSPSQAHTVQAALTMDAEPVRWLADFARSHAVILVVGSLIMQVDGAIKNRQLVIDAGGKIVGVYDKMHLFDVALETGERHQESAVFSPGTRPLLSAIGDLCVGHSICYDLRFPALYRAYAEAGADCLLVPAAFTRTTGQAHWLTLLRARAIENGAFVVAAAQCGETQAGRQTFGHSVVFGPWGDWLGQLQDQPGVLTVDLDRTAVTRARRQIPVLDASRSITVDAHQQTPS